MNPYIEAPGAVAAKDQIRASYQEWRNSFDPIDWELAQITTRQRLIDEGATVRPDGRLEIMVEMAR